MADWDSTKSAFDKVKADVGEVDVLVNNAGITRDVVFRKMTRADWDAVIDTNPTSLFNVTKQVIDGMADRGWGRIVNISSVNGQKGQFGQTNYSTAKAGLHGFTTGAGAGSGHQGRDGQYGVAGLYRHGHGQVHPPGCAGQDRGDDSGQAPGPAGGNRVDLRVAGIGRIGFSTGADFSLNGGLHMGRPRAGCAARGRADAAHRARCSRPEACRGAPRKTGRLAASDGPFCMRCCGFSLIGVAFLSAFLSIESGQRRPAPN